jgi:hypothetical protein
VYTISVSSRASRISASTEALENDKRSKRRRAAFFTVSASPSDWAQRCCLCMTFGLVEEEGELIRTSSERVG